MTSAKKNIHISEDLTLGKMAPNYLEPILKQKIIMSIQTRCVSFRLEKLKYEEIKAAADAAGEKVNGYIKKAIDQRMERENVLPMVDQQPTPNGPSQQTTTIPGEIQDTHHKYLTEEDEKKIYLQRILSDIHS